MIDQYKPLYAEDINNAYFDVTDELLTSDTRASEADIIRNAYMLKGAKLLFDALVEILKEADK